MSRHRHHNMEELLNNKRLGGPRYRQENILYPSSQPALSEDIGNNAAADDNAVRSLAYQIYCEKGGSALDNWVEAQQILKNNRSTVSSFISEGNPNM